MLYCDGGDLYTKIKEQNGKYLEETQIVTVTVTYEKRKINYRQALLK